MQFVEFARVLEQFLSGRKRSGEYIRDLFLSICDPPEDGYLYKVTEATLRSYTDGKRGISRPAKEALSSLNREKFVERLQRLSEGSLDSLASELVKYDLGLTAGSVCEDAADLFIEILKDGANRKRGKGSPKEDSTDDEDLLSSLVIEEGNRCPVCGSVLFRFRNGKQTRKCRVVAALPPNARMDYTVERDYTNALPEGCSEFCEVSEIALCNKCADDYEDEPSVGLYVRMAKGWRFLQRRDAFDSAASDLSLDDRISVVLDEIALADKTVLGKLRMEAVPLKRKIKGDNALLAMKIATYVTGYYRFIEERLRDLDGSGSLSFGLIAAQVRLLYQSIAAKEASQSAVFSAVAAWIGRNAGSTDMEACEAIAAFFVQNCEVFDEIAE